MSDTLIATDVLKGGEFLIRDSKPEDTFIPEDFSEEQLMVRQMTIDFLEQEVVPVMAKIEKQEPGVTVGLLERAGQLGLLGTHIPVEYGGTGMDTNTNTIIKSYGIR